MCIKITSEECEPFKRKRKVFYKVVEVNGPLNCLLPPICPRYARQTYSKGVNVAFLNGCKMEQGFHVFLTLADAKSYKIHLDARNYQPRPIFTVIKVLCDSEHFLAEGVTDQSDINGLPCATFKRISIENEQYDKAMNSLPNLGVKCHS